MVCIVSVEAQYAVKMILLYEFLSQGASNGNSQSMHGKSSNLPQKIFKCRVDSVKQCRAGECTIEYYT